LNTVKIKIITNIYIYTHTHMSNVLKAVPCLCFQARERGSALLGLLHKANHEDQFLFNKWMAVKEPLQKEVAESEVPHTPMLRTLCWL